MTKTPLLPFILVTSLFLMWGLANNMTDTLLAAFKKIMSMTDFQTSWIQVAFYGSYFCLAIPAALFIKRFTYKAGVLLGLGLFIIGAVLFYPASKTMLYGHFLAALFILAGGLSILETTANPYILAMGPQESATRRLNLAQSFNPIGSIIGVILSKFFILSNLNTADASARASMSSADLRLVQSEELSAVMGPYVGVAGFLAALWITIAVVRMPRASDVGSDIQIGAAVRRLLSKKHYVLGVVAQFFYVGAQICVWSFTIRYVMQELGLNEDDAATYYLSALVLFTLSRFICTWLMKFVAPGQLLTIMALMAMLFTAIVIMGGGMVGVVALVSISGCMSLMFPTIFGLASAGLEGDRKIGGSGLIMAILGGAVLTMIMGQVSDASGSIKLAFIVPLLCFLIITYYGYQTQRMQVQR
ncbi:MAG: L-fucose:H+ symporter permease [Saprospiraceae bacterium]|nr:L-fucose:H+ symporter permease [Saprospiraceae bacterium]